MVENKIKKQIQKKFTDLIPKFSSLENSVSRQMYFYKSESLDRNFKKWLEKIFFIKNHRLRDIIWDKAYINGHWGGYEKIYEYYKEYVSQFI